ncbi:MAG: PEP-CTERM sorting domain-containing protein [Phycisphaerae bacterium]|nr:PEP-CTERM sorting domain-containing protein [Phycisphaerae bacterium]
MKCSNKTKVMILGLLVLFFAGSAAFAATTPPPPYEPVEYSGYRELRSDYVKDWYIFIDTDNNGILNPGDQRISVFKNWWSTRSSSTMHNQDINWSPSSFPVDKPSSPMNWATEYNPAADPTKPEDNYWLTQKEDRMGFYMNYSQWNNSPEDFYTKDKYNSNSGAGGVSDDGKLAAYYREKYGDRNGYAMAWLTNKNNVNGSNAPRSNVTMDVYIHDGKWNQDVQTFSGTDKSNNSNPQVAQSNDIYSDLATDPISGLRYPGKYNEGTHDYDAAVNQAWKDWFQYGGKTLSNADLATIAAAMEIREVDPESHGSGLWANIFPGKSAEEIRLNPAIKQLLLDDNQQVLEYLYQDAMMDRSTYAENATDGGVISGLGAYGSEDFDINEWTQQQVIRLDLDFGNLTERTSLIDEVVFYDFGAAAGASQINPVEIMFSVDGSGNLFFDANNDGIYDQLTDVYLPDNRIYIAQVDITPEPATLVLLSVGMVGIVTRRLRKKSTK